MIDGNVTSSAAHPARREWQLLALITTLGMAIRLILINQPFVDAWSWRQSDVAMIADNFYRHGYNIFFPQVNWGGNTPGYVGTEFPLLSWLAALFYPLLGPHEWIGRTLCVAAWTASAPALFLLARRLLDPVPALLGVAIYALVPLGVFTARSFMPDTPSLALTLWATTLFLIWLDRPRSRALFIAAALLAALAFLVKITSLVLAPVLLAMAYQVRGWRIIKSPGFWLFPILALLPSFFWYRHAFYIGRTYFPYHAFGEDGLQFQSLALYAQYARTALHQSFTPLLCVTALLGLPFLLHRRRWPLFIWLLSMITYFFIAGRGNRHPWYQLPLVPALSLIAALPLARAWNLLHSTASRLIGRIIPVASFFLCMGLVSFQSLKSLYAVPDNEYFLPAAAAVRQIVPQDALVVAAVDSGDPAIFFYQQRHGWFLPAFAQTGLAGGRPLDSASAIRELELRRTQGARYFIVTRWALWWLDYYQEFRTHLDTHYQKLAGTSDYILYKLTPPAG